MFRSLTGVGSLDRPFIGSRGRLVFGPVGRPVIGSLRWPVIGCLTIIGSLGRPANGSLSWPVTRSLGSPSLDLRNFQTWSLLGLGVTNYRDHRICQVFRKPLLVLYEPFGVMIALRSYIYTESSLKTVQSCMIQAIQNAIEKHYSNPCGRWNIITIGKYPRCLEALDIQEQLFFSQLPHDF